MAGLPSPEKHLPKGALPRGVEQTYTPLSRRITLIPSIYEKLGKSLEPLKPAIEFALETLRDPDDVSARTHHQWRGFPGLYPYCVVDYAGNATVVLPHKTDGDRLDPAGSKPFQFIPSDPSSDPENPPAPLKIERESRRRRAVTVTHIPGWFLQALLRVIVKNGALYGYVGPLFEGHDYLGALKNAPKEWFEMPVLDDGAFSFPSPHQFEILEEAWCHTGPGLIPFHIHPVVSSWFAATNNAMQKSDIVTWTRPRLSLTLQSGVTLETKKTGVAATNMLRDAYRLMINFPHRVTHKTVVADQRLRLIFNRVTHASDVPQGWQATQPDLGKASPQDFLPPPLNPKAMPEGLEPYKLPQDLVKAADGPAPDLSDEITDEDDPRLILPEPDPPESEEQASDKGPELGPELPPDLSEEEPFFGPEPPPKEATQSAPSLEMGLPARRYDPLKNLQTTWQKPPARFHVSLPTQTGEVIGFYSQQGISKAAGKNMSWFLQFMQSINSFAATVAEAVGRIFPSKSDLMILEPLLLEIIRENPGDGQTHYEVSVRPYGQRGWIEPGDLQDLGTEDLRAMRDIRPFYQVKIRYTGDIKVGVRQPVSNIMTFAMLGFVELHLEKLDDPAEFDNEPYATWHRRAPKPGCAKSLGYSDILENTFCAGLLGDTLGEVVDTASLVGGFTPAVVLFDIIDVANLVVYYATDLYTLTDDGKSDPRDLFGRRVDTLQWAMMWLSVLPVVSKGKLKAGATIVGATGAFGMLGWTAVDTAFGNSPDIALSGELAKRFEGYRQLETRANMKTEGLP